MGVAATNLVRSFADNIIMPIVEPILPGKEWQTWILDLDRSVSEPVPF